VRDKGSSQWLRWLVFVAVAACGARTGLETEAETSTPPPGAIITGILSISAGLDHTCALRSDGTVVCWGANTVGQLGDGTTNQLTNDPVVVSSLTDAVAISAGPDFTCAVRSGGTVVCWGSKQLGAFTAKPTASPTPASVGGLPNVTAVAVALGSTCAIVAGGVVTCWSALSGPVTATPVPALAGSVAIANGLTQCGLTADGTVTCTGWALESPLVVERGATAITNASSNVSPSVTFPTALGCALLAGGAVSCWSLLDHGGPVMLQSAEIPLAPVTAIATSGAHTCAVLADTTVACWGANNFGQLGNGTTEDSPTPVAVSGLSGATAIATGWYHTCAVLSNGTGACWGNNQLRSDEGGITNTSTPVTVTF
jgi:hypothetical protein